MPKVTDLTAASTPLAGTETVYVVQGGNSRKATVNDVQNGAQNASRIKLQTEVAAASQTAITFTGIPTWVNRVTVMGVSFSTNGTSPLTLRVGDGAIVTTGYLGSHTQISGATPATVQPTSGVRILTTTAATNVMRFTMTINRESGNTWVIDGIASMSDTAVTAITTSSISLTGNLDRVSVTTNGGTDTFDAGAVNISWE